ncbi:MAG TPA: S1 RNA-binding domain-containing protein, partial [Planctomycetaceae bacterium]|nr:S1 RNA-binding domain-containing protein [Planctomycetaceae bacterium]
LEPGVEGMVHISELDHKRINRVADVVSVGQALELQVREVDPVKRRISLSLKALKARPEAAPAPADEDSAPAATPPRRKTPLKGGRELVDRPNRGGMFGNPGDYR